MAQVLRPLRQLHADQTEENLLVGLDIADDAAIYRLNDEQAIISTADFFTPVVDDPYDYGAIAAANSMSDIYAMGGEVLFALNIAGFPTKLDPAIISEILRGGAEKVIEAGAVVAGGHTVQDEEPKYGLAVTGLVHPERYFIKGGARPGDQLVLTKPLGTGTISTALKQGVAQVDHITPMVASMKHLNRCAAQAAQASGDIRAVTDITGFGLLGHSMEMAQAGRVRFKFIFDRLPFFDGAVDYAAKFIFPGGASNNKLYFAGDVTFSDSISEDQQMLLWDPQTSGGLLLAVPQTQLETFQAACAAHTQSTWVIGQVEDGSGIIVV